MLPRSFINYIAYARAADSKLNRQILASLSTLDALFNFCRDGFVNFFISISISSFRKHILNVICGSSNKKMVGSNTFSVVAFVADEHSTRDGAKMYFVAQSVGGIVDTLKRYLSVTIGTYHASPLPTLFSFFNFTPKQFHYAAHDQAINIFVVP
jgi:hypothetical protein